MVATYFHNVCVLLNHIDFDREERKICRDCVGELGGGGQIN